MYFFTYISNIFFVYSVNSDQQINFDYSLSVFLFATSAKL